MPEQRSADCVGFGSLGLWLSLGRRRSRLHQTAASAAINITFAGY
jgi:hypothetical protein